MECLRDYIGVRGCGQSVPPSLLYLNDLEGISLKALNSLADTQQQTFAGVYTDIQTRALMRLADDFKAAIGKRFTLKSIGDSISIPKSRLDTSATSIAPDETDKVGITIDLDYQYSSTPKQFTISPLSCPYVQEIWYYCDAGAASDTVTFYIIDTETNTTLYTTTKACSEGWNKVEVNKTFANNYFDKSRKLFIGVDVTTNNGTLTPQYMDCSNIHNTGSCCSMKISGAIMDDADHIIEYDECFGLSAIVGIRCDFGSLICTNKDVFKRTLLYALGAETMKEQLYSDRLNEYTTIRRDRAGELLEAFLKDYKESLEQVTSSISLECDCCIECGGSYSYQIIETV